jgi:hypothetical protein
VKVKFLRRTYLAHPDAAHPGAAKVYHVTLVQLGVNNSTVILSFNAQLPECFAADYGLIRHLDQGSEKKQLSIYLRRETLGTAIVNLTSLARFTTWPHHIKSQSDLLFPRIEHPTLHKNLFPVLAESRAHPILCKNSLEDSYKLLTAKIICGIIN